MSANDISDDCLACVLELLSPQDLQAAESVCHRWMSVSRKSVPHVVELCTSHPPNRSLASALPHVRALCLAGTWLWSTAQQWHALVGSLPSIVQVSFCCERDRCAELLTALAATQLKMVPRRWGDDEPKQPSEAASDIVRRLDTPPIELAWSFRETLETLDLTGSTNVGDGTVRSILSLHTGLRDLRISDCCRVTLGGFRAAIEAPRLRVLCAHTLDLSDVAEPGCVDDALAECPPSQLERLDVSCANVTAEACDLIRRRCVALKMIAARTAHSNCHQEVGDLAGTLASLPNLETADLSMWACYDIVAACAPGSHVRRLVASTDGDIAALVFTLVTRCAALREIHVSKDWSFDWMHGSPAGTRSRPTGAMGECMVGMLLSASSADAADRGAVTVYACTGEASRFHPTVWRRAAGEASRFHPTVWRRAAGDFELLAEAAAPAELTLPARRLPLPALWLYAEREPDQKRRKVDASS